MRISSFTLNFVQLDFLLNLAASSHFRSSKKTMQLFIRQSWPWFKPHFCGCSTWKTSFERRFVASWLLFHHFLDDRVLFVEQFPDLVVFVTDTTLNGYSARIVPSEREKVNNDVNFLLPLAILKTDITFTLPTTNFYIYQQSTHLGSNNLNNNKTGTDRFQDCCQTWAFTAL